MLTLFRLFLEEAPRATLLVVLLSLAAATTQATALFFVAEAAARGGEAPFSGGLFPGFLAVLGLFIGAKLLALRQAVRVAERIGETLRQRLGGALADTELRTLERLGRDRLDRALTVETTSISTSLCTAVNALQNGALIGACLLYIAVRAPLVVVFLGVITGLAVFSNHIVAEAEEADFREATGVSERLLLLIRQYLDGFKDLKLQAHRRRAGLVLADLEALQAELHRHRSPPVPVHQRFDSLVLRRVVFDYGGDDDGGFCLGPVDLELHPGEVVFIVGGNGSSKSTLLKVLSGLYPVSSGSILLDERPVAPADFRGLFGAVFVDFHLFERLYGVPEVDPAQVAELLARLDLTHKTELVDGRFSQTRLSTGQRKRLAMIATLLEDRPVLVFDEWTTDRDPEFRAFFYRELLPALKARGKTVIAVSHDDRFFDTADQLIKLEFGRQRRSLRDGRRRPMSGIRSRIQAHLAAGYPWWRNGRIRQRN